MNAPQVSPAVLAWEQFRGFAQRQGWQVDLTPRGRTKCSKDGSVVFGPGSGTNYAELIKRIGHIDGFMAGWRKSRP